jgi:hypothetical protein
MKPISLRSRHCASDASVILESTRRVALTDLRMRLFDGLLFRRVIGVGRGRQGQPGWALNGDTRKTDGRLISSTGM